MVDVIVEEEQTFMDFPCPLCKRIHRFVSSLNPAGLWICTHCQVRVGDDKMLLWRKAKEKLEAEGKVIRIGMVVDGGIGK